VIGGLKKKKVRDFKPTEITYYCEKRKEKLSEEKRALPGKSNSPKLVKIDIAGARILLNSEKNGLQGVTPLLQGKKGGVEPRNRLQDQCTHY